MTPPIALVVAIARNGTIGDAGRIPWRIAEDMRHFKALTLGNPCIMGRRTWESLPKKPLPGRTNIVVTRDRNFAADGALIAHNIDEALAIASRANPPEIMIVGGAEIYAGALPRASIIYLTEIHEDFKGDARMEAFDRDVWMETSREEKTTSEGLGFSFVTLMKRQGSPGASGTGETA
jgi:dihydrofolate reductase